MKLHLITGGSGSGKSAYAEMCLTGSQKACDLPLLYVATMMPFGEETKKKIARHRKLRAGKGFVTLERYTDLAGMEVPDNGGVLLECVSNLAANELYGEDGVLREEGEALRAVLDGVRFLAGKTECLVIVTNEVHSDGNDYSEETEKYRNLLGRINQELALLSDTVTEVVYGIPVKIKG